MKHHSLICVFFFFLAGCGSQGETNSAAQTAEPESTKSSGPEQSGTNKVSYKIGTQSFSVEPAIVRVTHEKKTVGDDEKKLTKLSFSVTDAKNKWGIQWSITEDKPGGKFSATYPVMFYGDYEGDDGGPYYYSGLMLVSTQNVMDNLAGISGNCQVDYTGKSLKVVIGGAEVRNLAAGTVMPFELDMQANNIEVRVLED